MGYRVRRAEKFNEAGYIANADVFDDPIIPAYSGTLRIQVEFSVAASISVTGAGATPGKLNRGVEVEPDSIEWFDLEVSKGRSYNFQLSAGMTIKQFLVTERMDDGK